MNNDILRCIRCGLAYRDFDLDVLVPDEQWSAISEREDGSGVMCGACIIARGARLPGVTVAKLVFEISFSEQANDAHDNAD